MKLYHSSFTRSGRARWMLEETGEPYEIVHVALSKGEHKKPEFLAINPSGAVPALVDGHHKLTESSAIILHLADKFPEKNLAPPLGSIDRAHYYRWLVYVPATVDPALEAITFHEKLLPADKRVPAIAEEGRRKWGAIARILEEAVDGREFIVGKHFTGADVAVASAIGWVEFLGMLGDHPKLAAYAKKHKERPAYVKAYAD